MAYRVFGQIESLNVLPANQRRVFICDTQADLATIAPLMSQSEVAYVVSDDTTWRMKAGGSLAQTSVSPIKITVDFGVDRSASVEQAVTGQSWVTANSILLGQAFGVTIDHPDPIEPVLEQVRFNIGNIIPGVGFTVYGIAPNSTYGQYNVIISGG